MTLLLLMLGIFTKDDSSLVRLVLRKFKVNLGPKHVCVILFVINAYVYSMACIKYSSFASFVIGYLPLL